MGASLVKMASEFKSSYEILFPTLEWNLEEPSSEHWLIHVVSEKFIVMAIVKWWKIHLEMQ